MPDNARKEDLRNRKTEITLINAMCSILERQNFKKITVSDLCNQAQISRATFYAHFNDKYDLMKYYLSGVKDDVTQDVQKYKFFERDINQFVNLNKKIIVNIMQDANSETLTLLREFILSIVSRMTGRKPGNTVTDNHIILYNFVVGGLLNLLTWLVENNFPPDIKMMNPYLYDLINAITDWDAQQE